MKNYRVVIVLVAALAVVGIAYFMNDEEAPKTQQSQVAPPRPTAQSQEEQQMKNLRIP